MEQPQDMRELIRSVEETYRHPMTKVVVPTIATREVVDLATPARQVLVQYLQHAQAEAMAIGSAAPGAMLESRQTDQWYRTHDSNGHAARLRGIVETLGQRMR
jgi:hypothetical protein